MLPPWLSVFPIRGSVPAGDSVDVHVAVNRMRACFGNETLSQQKTVNVRNCAHVWSLPYTHTFLDARVSLGFTLFVFDTPAWASQSSGMPLSSP